MRAGGAMLADVLAHVSKHIKAGITTAQLSRLADRRLKELGGQPAFLNYGGFPDVMCVSINDAVVHGIPDDKTVLKDGDVISLDFGVKHQGLITDAAITQIVGKPLSSRDPEMVAATQQALDAAIKAVKAGVTTGDIGAAIESVLDEHRLGIVRDLVGHGVGDHLHEGPNIPNYGKPGTGFRLQAGMTIAIEPMTTLGNYHVRLDSDGWTVRTRDGSRSAHFEHTVVVTEKGAEILTAQA